MGQLNQAPWSRIKGNNVALQKDQENVGNGKPTGSVQKETIAVSGTMVISVQNLRRCPLLLQNLRRSRMEKLQRERKVLEAEVRLRECLVCRAGIILKVHVQIHPVKNGVRQSVYFTRQKRDVLVHTARLLNSQTKSLKKWQKCCGYIEGHTTIGLRISRYGAGEILIDFTEELKHYETNPTCSIHQSRIASRHHLRKQRTIAWNNLPRGSSSA